MAICLIFKYIQHYYADVVELVYALRSKRNGAIHTSSSLVIGTINGGESYNFAIIGTAMRRTEFYVL